MAKLSELKVGQYVRNLQGYEGIIKRIESERTIDVLVTEVFERKPYVSATVGVVRNSFAKNLTVIAEPEEENEAYEVEVEVNDMIIRMDYKNFEKYITFMSLLKN